MYRTVIGFFTVFCYLSCVFQNDLSKRQAEQIVKGVLDELLEGLQSPDRPCSPIDAHITQEDIFSRTNPGVSWISLP